MTTNFKKLLKEKSESSLLDGKGDEASDGDFYLAAGASSFFALAGRALVTDGLDSKIVGRMMIDAAMQIMIDAEDEAHGYHPNNKKAPAEMLMKMGLSWMPDPPPKR